MITLSAGRVEVQDEHVDEAPGFAAGSVAVSAADRHAFWRWRDDGVDFSGGHVVDQPSRA
jgi:hypothetical protein